MSVSRIKQPPTEKCQLNVDLSGLQALLSPFENKKGITIPALQAIQNQYSYLPKEALQMMAEKLKLPLSDIYGVATFYSQFKLSPSGKHVIKICHGTACHVQNAKAITTAIEEALGILDGETTKDGLFTLESVACLGCCSLAPVMMIGNETYGKLTPTSTMKIINDLKMNAIGTKQSL